MFTTATILASFLLFSGFNTEGAGPAVTLLGGFVVIFTGVYLLNLNRLVDPVTQQPRMSLMTGEGVAGTGRLSEHRERLLGNAGDYRLSMSGRSHGGSFNHGHGIHGRRDSEGSSVLFNAYENQEEMGLTRLNESDDESEDAMSPALGKGEYNNNNTSKKGNWPSSYPPPSRPLSAGSNNHNNGSSRFHHQQQASSPQNSAFVNATSPLPDRGNSVSPSYARKS